MHWETRLIKKVSRSHPRAPWAVIYDRPSRSIRPFLHKPKDFPIILHNCSKFNFLSHFADENETVPEILGVGYFGVVIKARFQALRKEDRSTQETVVAVKMLNEDFDELFGVKDPLRDASERKQFEDALLQEMEMLLMVGHHVNIVNLIGVVLEGTVY